VVVARRTWDLDAQAFRVSETVSIGAVTAAANEPRVLAFRSLLAVAKELEYLLGRAIEREFGISHAMFEVLLLLGRAGRPVPMREISQAQLLTSGGATRLVARMEAAHLVRRDVNTRDGRVHLVSLTQTGESTMVRAAHVHALNVQRYMLDGLPYGERDLLLKGLTMLRQATLAVLPEMP
jgi:DNA-binding MarR family transcriptional regulator